MPRTGVFVANPEALYAGEHDPITLDTWAHAKLPLALNGDPRHFYQSSDDVFKLRKNPLTDASVGLDQIEPIIHPQTGFEAYLAQLQDLRNHGWRRPDVVEKDLRDLYKHELDESVPGKRKPDAVEDLLAPRVLQFEEREIGGFAHDLWRATDDDGSLRTALRTAYHPFGAPSPCPVIENNVSLFRVSIPKRLPASVGRTNGKGRPPSPFLVQISRNRTPVCRCRMPALRPDEPSYVEYLHAPLVEVQRLDVAYRIRIVVQNDDSWRRVFRVGTVPFDVRGYVPSGACAPPQQLEMLGRAYGSVEFTSGEANWCVEIFRSPPPVER